LNFRPGAKVRLFGVALLRRALPLGERVCPLLGALGNQDLYLANKDSPSNGE